MSVITISQGTASGGRMLAESVCRRLNYRYVGREQIIEKAAQWGVSQEQLRAAIEKPPSFRGQSQHTKYMYLALVQAALTQEVRAGNVVYDGLAGQLLLGQGQHVLRTRIIAPMVFRISMLELRQNMSRKEAIAHIEKTDEERRRWTRFLHGVDWADPSLYDLVINLEHMTLVDASDAICTLAQSACFKPTEETDADLNNLALASWVRATLAMDAATSEHQFEVTAQHGHVKIKGGVDSAEQIRKIRAIVTGIPGVQEVTVRELALVTRI